MFKKCSKLFWALSISLIVLFFSFFPTISSEETNYIKYPIGVSSIITISDNNSVELEAHMIFFNPFENATRVLYDIPVSWIFRGKGEAYGTIFGDWTPIPDKKYYHFDGVLEPFKSHEVIFRRTIDKDDNNPEDEIYSIQYQCSIIENLSYNKVEVKIPIKKSLDELKIISYSVSPTSEFQTEDTRILRWEGELQNVISIKYTYEFDIFGFLNNPWILLIIGGLFGFGIERVYQYRKQRRKTGKIVIEKNKLDSYLEKLITGLLPLTGIFLVPFFIYQKEELLYASIVCIIALIILSLFYIIDTEGGKPKIDWEKVPDLIRTKKRRKR